MQPTVLSLFDRSGVWPRPYTEQGARAITVDIAPALPGSMYAGREHHELDISALDALWAGWRDAQIILLAPPCTHFSVSGARWWALKDQDGRTEQDVELVKSALEIVRHIQPRIWALENPTGPIKKLVPELGDPLLSFDPCDYGDPYTKRTHLWGRFNPNLPRTPVEPIRVCEQGSWVQKLGGTSERTKVLRSTTPAGFARAFATANPVEFK